MRTLTLRQIREELEDGDRIGVTKCPGTKRVFTFYSFDGDTDWMVSRSGINDYSPYNIYSINGERTKVIK